MSGHSPERPRIPFVCIRGLYHPHKIRTAEARFDAAEIEFDFAATPRNAPIRSFLTEILGTTGRLVFRLHG